MSRSFLVLAAPKNDIGQRGDGEKAQAWQGRPALIQAVLLRLGALFRVYHIPVLVSCRA